MGLSRLSELWDSNFQEEVPQRSHNKNKILLGYDMVNNCPFNLDISRTRHILITALQGAGKCFDYDSEVLLQDGTLAQIGKIVEDQKQCNVLSFNENTQKFEWKPIVGFHKNVNNKKMKKLLLEGNNEIIVTEDHKFLVYKNGDIQWAACGDISKDDFVLTPSSYDYVDFSINDDLSSNEAILLAYLIAEGELTYNFSFTNSDGTLVEEFSNVMKSLFGLVLRKSEKYAYVPRERELFYSGNSMSKNLISEPHKKILFTGDIFNPHPFFEKTEKEIFEGFEEAVGLLGEIPISKQIWSTWIKNQIISKYGSYNDFLIKHGIDVSNERKKEISKKYFELVSKLGGFHPRYTHLMKEYGWLGQKILSKFGTVNEFRAEKNIGKSGYRAWLKRYGIYKVNSRTKKIPDEIFRSSKLIQSIFLKRLFSCDGSIGVKKDKSNRVVLSYSSSSKCLIKAVRHLLLRFGINSYLRYKKKADAYELNITDTFDVERYLNNIGFVGQKKILADSLIKNIFHSKYNNYGNAVPNIQYYIEKKIDLSNVDKSLYKKALLRSGKDRFLKRRTRDVTYRLVSELGLKNDSFVKLFLNNDIRWVKVKSIINCEDKNYVYDITVMDNHNFVVNDIVAHNSVLLHRLIDGYEELGASIDVVNDKHGEFRYKDRPNQAYFNQLERGASIAELNIEDFMPVSETPHPWKGFQRFSPEFCSVNDTIPLSFKLTDLEEDDWQELLAIAPGHVNRRLIFQLFFRHLKEMRTKDPSIIIDKKTMRECADINVLAKHTFFLGQADQLSQDDVQMEIERFWKDFIEEGVFEGAHITSVRDMLYDDNGNRRNIIIDWSEFKEGITKKSEIRRDAYIAILLNRLFEWNKEKPRKEVNLTALDEAQKILTSGYNPYSINFLKTIFTEGRKFDQHVMCAFQGEVKKVHPLLFENMDFFLISSKNASRQSLTFLRDSYPDIFEWKGDLKSFAQLPMHSFLAIDKHSDEVPFTVVVSYPPLSTLYRSI